MASRHNRMSDRLAAIARQRQAARAQALRAAQQDSTPAPPPSQPASTATPRRECILCGLPTDNVARMTLGSATGKRRQRLVPDASVCKTCETAGPDAADISLPALRRRLRELGYRWVRDDDAPAGGQPDGPGRPGTPPPAA